MNLKTIAAFALLLAFSFTALATQPVDKAQLRAQLREQAQIELQAQRDPANQHPSTRDIVPIDNASILVIKDSWLNMQQIPAIESVLQDLDFQIAFWDVQENGPITTDAMNHDWDLVILMADNSAPFPTRAYEDSPLSNYVTDGGNLFYADQDYFWANNEDLAPIFNPGDFAYDAFGVESGENDAVPNDSAYLGVNGDPITHPFYDDAYWTDPQITFNWDDFVYPTDEATEIFHGEFQNNCAGFTYENSFGGRIGHVSFNMMGATHLEGNNWVMDAQFSTLLENVMNELAGPPYPGRLNLIPQITIVPPEGGIIAFDVNLLNSTPFSLNGVRFWTIVTLPNNQEFGPMLNYPFNVTPFMDVTVQGLVQSVPNLAPNGIYTYSGYAGFFPNPILEDSFTFEKLSAATSPGEGDYSDLALWQADGSSFLSLQDSADPTETARIDSYALQSVYPNPFNPATTISVSLPEAAELKVTVVNALGQRVAELANDQFNAGTHNFTFDGSALASGIYFVHAAIPGNLNAVQKIVLMK